MFDLDALKAGLQGEVLENPPEPLTYDGSHRFRKTPRLVVKARCEADVAHTLKMAHAASIPVTLRGGGFSMNGQTLSEDGILLVNETDQPDFVLDEQGMVNVSTRTRWYDLEAALNACGRSVPVLTYFLAPTIGGTLSLGGYGMRSIRLGAQVDQVQRLKLVKPDGSSVWCSLTENSELFRYALAGQGQVGLIERAVFPSLSGRNFAIQFHYKHSSLTEMAASLAWLNTATDADLPDIVGVIYGGNSRLIMSSYGFEKPTRKQAMFTGVPKPLRGKSPDFVDVLPWFHRTLYSERSQTADFKTDKLRLWMDMALDYDGFCKMMAFIEAECVNPYLGTCIILPVRRLGTPLPFAAHNFATNADLIFGFGLYYFVPTEDTAGINSITRLLRQIQDRALDMGGRIYLYGFHEMDAALKHQVYGQDYLLMKQLRQQLDPQNLLNAHTF